MIAQCTTFQFTVQPPTILDCNPFDTVPGTPVWRLRTRCTVERLNGTQSFDVNWFHRKRTGEIENLSRPEIWSEPALNEEEVYFGGQLTNRPYTENMLGEYWCQVVVENQVLLGISNVFTINDPYSYDADRCIGIKSVPKTLCADNPPQVSVSSSTLDLHPSSSNGITLLTISPTSSQHVAYSSPVTTISSITSVPLASVESSKIISVLTPPISDNLGSTTSTKILKSSSTGTTMMTSPLSTPSTTAAMVSPSSTVNNNIPLDAPSSTVNNNVSKNAIVMSTLTSSTPTVSSATASDNTMLLTVSAAAIVMLLLIIILLVVIIVLISTKPRQRREIPG